MNRSLRTCVLSTPLLSLGLTLGTGCADPAASMSPGRNSGMTPGISIAAGDRIAPAPLQVSAAARPLGEISPAVIRSNGGWIEQTAALQPRGKIRAIGAPSDAETLAIREPEAPALEVARLPSDVPSVASDGLAAGPQKEESPKYLPAEIPIEPRPEVPAPQLSLSAAEPNGDRTWRLDDQVRHLPAPKTELESAPATTLRPDDGAAIRAVADRANELVRHAYSLGQRGASFSARAELIQSLRLIAQARDAQQGGDEHSAALARGLQALQEADDFAPKGSRLEADLNVAQIVRAHRSEILKSDTDIEVSPLVALQRYYTYAQQQLAVAGGGMPAASHALYCLGKMQTVLADSTPESQRLQGPKAMTFYQAALLVDGGNYLAANELGVMLARYGQLQDARRVLLHSVATRPHLEGWHNLAVVHARLGEPDLAQRADYERQLLASQQGLSKDARSPLGDVVQWVDPRSFASHGVSDQTTAAAAPANRKSTINTAKAPSNHQR